MTVNTEKKQLNDFDPERLAGVTNAIKGDIAQGKYYGANIIVARHGKIALNEQIGNSGPDLNRELNPDTVFSLFSLTKGFVNVLILRAIERGDLALTTRVVDIIPEFKGGEREKITVFHLLTHSSGLASVWIPKPGMCVDRFDEVVEAVCEFVHCVAPVGELVTYAPLAHHVLLGEMLRRVDTQKRRIRDILNEDLFQPLGMTSTALGVRQDLKHRHIRPDWIEPCPAEVKGHNIQTPTGGFEEEEAEMPWVGAISTAGDIHRFAEMLRRGGEFNGVRILSPAILDLATRNWTGQKDNELYKALYIMRNMDPAPAYIGLGFGVRGDTICHSQMGTLNSPRAHCNNGAGSTLYWVDPQRDITFVCLCAGVVEESYNVLRFQRLSDLVLSAAI